MIRGLSDRSEHGSAAGIGGRLVMTHRNGKLDRSPGDRDSEVRMRQPHRPPARSVFGSLVLIAVVVGAYAAAFAYTAGWFSPQRLTPDKMVDAFKPSPG